MNVSGWHGQIMSLYVLNRDCLPVYIANQGIRNSPARKKSCKFMLALTRSYRNFHFVYACLCAPARRQAGYNDVWHRESPLEKGARGL